MEVDRAAAGTKTRTKSISHLISFEFRCIYRPRYRLQLVCGKDGMIDGSMGLSVGPGRNMYRGDDMSVARNATLHMPTSPFGSIADGSFCCNLSSAVDTPWKAELRLLGTLVQGQAIRPSNAPLRRLDYPRIVQAPSSMAAGRRIKGRWQAILFARYPPVSLQRQGIIVPKIGWQPLGNGATAGLLHASLAHGPGHRGRGSEGRKGRGRSRSRGGGVGGKYAQLIGKDKPAAPSG